MKKLYHSIISKANIAVLLLMLVFCSLASAATVTYTYDNLNRLNKVVYGNGAVIEYTYDAAGNRLSLVSVADTTPPTGTISINSDAVSTNSTTATLTVSCTDTNGCSHMQFSNDNTTWSTAETFATSKAWTLTSDDGTKTAYVKFKDTAGNWSTVTISDTIVLDATAPTTTASPAGGIYNSTQSVTLTCSDGTGSGCDKIYYTTDGTTPSTLSTLYIIPITVSTTTTLQFFANDLAGNSETVKSEAYTIDTTAPTGTISINSDAVSTNSTTTTLTLSCSDANGCAEMQFSNDNSTWSTAETYTTSKAWTLASGDGTKTVYAQFNDVAGNVSGSYSDTIIFDTTLPEFTAVAPYSDSLINTATVGYTLSEQVASGNITFTWTGGTNDPSSPQIYNLAAPDMTAGTHTVNTGLSLVNSAIYTVTFEATDLAGNVATPISGTNVTFDATSASVTINTPASGSVTNNVSVGFTLSEAISSGNIVFTATGGNADAASPHTYTLAGAELAAGAHSVTSGITLVDGAIYTVSIENVFDMAGNATAAVANTSITYDSTSVAITNTAPAANSAIATATVSYTLSEQAQSGTVTFTQTGGSTDAGSPHTYTLSGADLSSGDHSIDTGLGLVDGAIYTVSFDATDMAGNAATTVSNAIVLFDNIHDITVTITGSGTVTPSGATGINHGDTRTFTATPDPGNHIDTVTGCGGILSGNTYTTGAITADCTVTANFAIDTFAVNFASGGNGTLTGTANQTINYGGSATAVTAVPATGYHFVNWTGDGGFATTTSNPLTVTNITAVQTITANFAIDTFAVNFASDVNGTLTGTASQTINYGSSATAVTVVPNTGYHFVNWTGTGGFVTTTSNPLTVTNVTADQTITANFAINTYTVSFTSNGGSAITSQSIAYNTTATEPTAPTKTGNTFAGWYSDSGLTTSFAFTTAITGDTTLYAKWTVNNYTVSFTSNGGSAVSSQSVVYNTTATEPTAPTKTGYTFGGWYSDSGLTTTFAFATAITADTTLYAKWTVNNYTVSFNSNGGSAVSSESIAYNSTATAPTAPTKTGNTFAGWYSDSGLTSSFTFTTAITADTTLYAKWTVNSYTVTFNSNGGTSVSSISTNYNTTISEPTAPTKNGNTFAGWYSDSGLTTAFAFTTAITADTTLYAKWDDTTPPVFTSTSPASDIRINTTTVGYTLSEAVGSGSITFTRTGGSTDSTVHTYMFVSVDMTAGSHSINTGLPLVSGAIYTVAFDATDLAGNLGSLSNTNVTYDTTSATVTLSSPASSSRVNNSNIGYTMSEAISSGNIVFTRTGGNSDAGSPHTYTLAGGELAAGAHSVSTGMTLVDGAVYTVSIENVFDMAGNATAAVSNTSITYDSTSGAITNTTPAANSAIADATVSYTLSEQAQGGTVTFTQTGGSTDAGSPHTYTMSGADLSSGDHTVDTGLGLVDGAVYTVSFNATDMAGNAATTVSNAMVLFDSIHDITVTISGSGTITPSGATGVSHGDTRTFTATPDPGYHIASITGCGGILTGNTFTTGVITADCTVTANFAINSYTITTSAGVDGVIDASAIVNYGGNLIVNITPNTGYHVADVLVDGSSVGAVTGYSFINVAANYMISTSFAINTFTVTPSAGTGGTISPNTPQIVNYNGTTSFTVTPNTGYHIASVTGCGGILFVNTYTTGAITIDCSVTANFAIDPFTVTPTAGAGGAITPSTPQILNYNGTTAFTMTPNTGYQINTVTGCGGTLTGNTYTTGVITGDCTVTASFIDVAQPVMTLSTLSNGSITNNNTLNISGTVTDNTGVQGLTVNGIPVTVNTDGSFSHALFLNEGSNIINIVATDQAGNQTTDTRTITLDTTAPALNIFTPADNSKTAESIATVTGSIDETSIVTITLNGGTPQYASITGNTFTLDIVLASGINTIEVTATDTAGNTSTQSTQKRTVTYDPDKPSLAITDPAQDIRTNQGSMIIKGTVSDTLTAVSVLVTVDGNTYTPTLTNGQFEQAVTFTTEKTYTIAVTATDEAGNTTTVQRNIIYDITQPTIDFTVTTPTNMTGQTITGSMEEGSTVTVTSATATIGTVTYPSGTTWSVNVTGMAEGSNAITATAKDAAGNETTVSKQIVVDTIAPATTASPAAGTYTSGQSVTLTANETATIYYTTDGSTPSTLSTVYTTPITVSSTTTLKFFAKDLAGNSETVKTENYVRTYSVIASAGAGGAIAPTGTVMVTHGLTAAFTVTPDTGYHISSVTGCGGTLAGDTYTVGAVTADCAVSATFVIDAFAVNFISGGNGTLTGTASQTIDYGGSATTVTAVPSTGYHLVNWTGDGGFVTTTSNPLTVTNVTTAQTITANFEIDTFAVNFTSGGNGTLTGTASQTINYGGSATAVTAVPAIGYHLVNWTGDGGFVTTTNNPLTVTNVTAAQTITANFEIDAFAVNFASGGNGTLTGTASQIINYGSSATAVTAVPATGYHLVNWTGTGGFVTTTNNPLTVTTVTAAQTITANFVISSYDITVSKTGTGTGTVASADSLINCGADCAEIYNYGATVTLTATADAGSSFTGWSGACSGTGVCTITVDAVKSVTATFDDTELPVLTVSTLSSGAFTNTETLNISGTATDNTGVQGLTVNSVAVTVNTDGTFSHALVLNQGANIITTVATDLAGNETTDTRTITLDITAPALAIDTPADNSKTAASIATVTGTIDETSTVTVTLNGGTPQYAAITGNTFTQDILLASGVNTIEVTAIDTAGNTSTLKRTVTYDSANPSLEVTEPNQDIRTNQNSIIIKGSVSDTLTAVSVSVTVDGNTYTPILTNGQFEQVVTFTTEKTYTITVTATDEAGNETTVQRNVIYDTTQPVVDFTVATPTINTSQAITGTMEEGSTITVTSSTATVGAVTYPTATTWSANVTGMIEGSNTVTATATDAAGNEATVAKEIVVDTTAPATTASPSGGTYSSTQSVVLTANETATIYYTTNGTTPTTASTVYSGPITISTNTTVKYFAKDLAGNSETVKTQTYTIDKTLPAFSSISPASGSYINTATAGYSLSEAVSSGKITFTRTGGKADSTSHVYNFTSSDITAGSHSINTGLALVNGAVYTVAFEAVDSAGNTGTVTSTNVTYDKSSAFVTINSPASNSVTNNAEVAYTLTEDITAGNIIFTRTGGTADGMSPYTYPLSSSEMTTGTHTVNTGNVLMDGAIYTVSFENVMDMAGNATATVSNTSVTYDATAVAITNTSPASNSIITNSTVTYSLSEQASAGKVTFTWSGGTADPSSPHVYTFKQSDMTAGPHNINTNLTLVDGAFYTVSFDATDLVGNAATTVSNAMVYYESNYGTGPTGNVDNTSYSNNRVDGFDLIKLSIAFGSQSGDANWNPVCDLDGDGKVDGNDLITLGAHFGEVQ